MVISSKYSHKIFTIRALNLKTGQLVTQEAPTFSAQTFRVFIRFLLQSTLCQNYLILDYARWHRSKIPKEFFETSRHRLEFIYLPSYSPELNAIEKSGGSLVERYPQPLFPINRRLSVGSPNSLFEGYLTHLIKYYAKEFRTLHIDEDRNSTPAQLHSMDWIFQ